jgi:hypothetical protein
LKKSALKKITQPSAPDLAHSSVILKITGIDEPGLRRLASKGIIPRPKLSQWPLHETLAKLFAHRASEQSRLPVFDSMEACAGAGYFTKTFLQTLKVFGLAGFENSRVDFNKLIPDIESFFAGSGKSQQELQDESVSSFKEMREKYLALLARHEFRLSQGEAIAKSTAIETLRELLVIHHHSYGRMIEEWPSALAGESAAGIRTHVTKSVDALKSSEENAIKALERVKKKVSSEKEL